MMKAVSLGVRTLVFLSSAGIVMLLWRVEAGLGGYIREAGESLRFGQSFSAVISYCRMADRNLAYKTLLRLR